VSGRVRRVTAGLAILSVAVAPTAQAEPGPGSGETFFVDYMTRVFTPPTSEGAARGIIPLAQQVCAAKAQGQTDYEAASLVLAGNALERIGVASGPDDERAALDIVNAATLAYCPQYNPSVGEPIVPGVIS
jgi:hypothetical protein